MSPVALVVMMLAVSAAVLLLVSVGSPSRACQR